MKLAVNYSYPARELLQKKHIFLDYFKTPNWPDLVTEALTGAPVAVHFGLQAGDGSLARRSWDDVEQLLAQTGTRYVNLHLAAKTGDYPGIAPDEQTKSQRRAILDQMLKDVGATVEHFSAERVIIENIPYHGSGGDNLRTSVEPETIHQVISQTGCGLLLDISHARISAETLGLPERDYLNSLPVDQIREMHFTGIHQVDGKLQDHLAVLPGDWLVLDWVVEQINSGAWSRPWMLAFEYGGVGAKYHLPSDPAVIATQVPRLQQIIHKV